MPSNSNRPGSNFVDLGQQGLTPGDDLTPYIDSYFDSGNEVYIPPGDYTGDPQAFMKSVSNATIRGDDAGVTVDRGSTQVRGSMNASGNVLLENITFHGTKPELQSRWRIDTGGGDTCTLRNINWPDGTTSPSDSQAVYSEASGGEIRFENCFIGGHGNSLCYFTYSNAHLVIDGCTMGLSNGAVRPGTGGMTLRNSQWFSDGFVPQFSQDGGPGEGAFSRFLKFEQHCDVDIQNVHYWQTSQCDSPGPFMDDQSNVNGSISDVYLYNETGANLVRGGDGLSASNIHTSGGGDLGVPWSVSGSEQPNMTKNVWRPGQGSLPGGADDGGGTVERIDVDGETDLPAESAQTNFGTQVRTVHSGYNGSGFLDLEPPDDAWAEWDLEVFAPGDYDVTLRYSNGSSSPRVGRLSVGSDSTEVSFDPSGSWNTWQTVTGTLTFPNGETTLRLEETGSDTGQIDYVRLEPLDMGGGRTPQQTANLGGLALVGLGAAAVREYIND